MRTCVLFLALFGAAILGRAQAPCGADEVHAKAMEENPTYAMGFQASNAAWLNAPVATDTNEVVIPVVFHVIHTGAPYGQQENITDEQIQSAVVALNEDFGNASGEGFDTGISFVLACRDPWGAPTNGILRVDGTAVAGYESQGIAHAGSANGADEGDVKSLSTWPTESYINVWVVSEINDNDGGGGVQAYAAIGVSGGASDGVTIMHNLVGTVGTLKATDGLNKTMAHEFGHHLNLLHTFNDTYSCQPESNCQVQGDGVCDTPPTVENGGCNSPNCPGALIENLMDYTPNSCKTGFTQGQSDRMWTCLVHQRPGLLSSQGGVPVVAKDLALEALDGAMGCGDGYTPKVRVINQGEGLATGWGVTCWADGEWAGSLQGDALEGFGASQTLEFRLLTWGLGNHQLLFEVAWEEDGWPQNDHVDQTVCQEPLANWLLTVQTDFFATQTSWVLSDSLGSALVLGAGPSTGFFEFQYDLCLAPGCYTLEVLDAGGDGLQWGGSILLTTDGGDTLLSVVDTDEQNIGSGQTFTRCVPPWSGPSMDQDAATLGCTYPFATNWNPEATTDNGSCYVAGCMDPEATNYQPLATAPSGECLYDTSSQCFGDADGDGLVALSDLLDFLAVMGQTCD